MQVIPISVWFWFIKFCRFPSSTVKRGYSQGVVTLHPTKGRAMSIAIDNFRQEIVLKARFKRSSQNQTEIGITCIYSLEVSASLAPLREKKEALMQHPG
jgi:hypothetical protein